MNNIDIESIVSIKQMPQIFYALEEVGKELEIELKKIDGMPCNEDTKREVKKIRSNVNKTLENFESKRIQIKEKLLEPYNLFNEKYQEEIKDKLENASIQLTNKINDIEQEQIANKTLELIDFINEHIESRHLETILNSSHVIDLAPLKINLSNSLKSLKEKALEFIERVANEVALIKLEEKYSEEILHDYMQNDFDYASSKLFVLNRHKEIEQIKNNNQSVENVIERENKNVEVIDEVMTPIEVIEDDEILQCTFTIKTTKEKIILLKKFMKEIGIEVE